MTEADIGAETTDQTTAQSTDEAPSAPATPAPPPTRSEVALSAHARRLHRARVLYGSIVGVVVLVVLLGVLIAWNRGEISHATLHTIAPVPSNLALAEPSADPQPAWRTSDQLAFGTPLYGGTVVTYSQHTVGGRDARTGRRTWSYTRSDRTVCVAAQTTSTTIAVFKLHGNCDEVAAFDSDSGRRRWARTLDKDARPLDGPVTFQLTSTEFMLTGRSVIYALDPATGVYGWNYFRYGCQIQRAVLGSAGALISQTCGDAVNCKGIKFCAPGPQLLLRDASAGVADNGDNRDQIKWLRRGDSTVPVSADSIISTLQPGGRTLIVLDAKAGRPQRQVDLGGPGATDTTTVGLANAELIWRDGRTYAVDNTSDKPAWTARTAAPPTAVTGSGEPGPGLADARITATAGGDVLTLSGTDGTVRKRFGLGAPAGATAYPMGTGFLVGGPSGATAYR